MRRRIIQTAQPAAVLLLLGLLAVPAGAQLDLSSTTALHQLSDPPFGPPVGEGHFGRAMASGDFDGDGFADLAVTEHGRPGRVLLLSGGPGGLSFADVLSQAEAEDFGVALASCDFDEDGFDDLAIGAPRTTVDGLDQAGRVYIYHGSSFGLFFEQSFDQSDADFVEVPERNDRFGRVLAAGIAEAPGCDLAIGVPDEHVERDGTGYRDAGLVHVVRGDGTGLDPATTVNITQESDPAGVQISEEFDGFGSALALGVIGGEGAIVIGVPEKDRGAVADAGVVWVHRLSGAETEILDSGSSPDPDEEFGSSLVLADIDAAFGNDIVIGSPGATVLGASGAGRVFVFLANGPGLDFFGVDVDQDFFGNAPEPDERFGEALAIADLNADHYPDIFIGAPLADVPHKGRGGLPLGALHVVQPWADGYATYLPRDLFPGTAQVDRFTESLLLDDFNGDGGVELVIGAPLHHDVLAERGVSDDYQNGIIYYVPGPARLHSAELYVRTGVAVSGTSGRTIEQITDVAVDALGTPAVRGALDDGEAFVFAGSPGALTFLDSDDPSANLQAEFLGKGLAYHQGAFAFPDRSIPASRGTTFPLDENALYSSGGVLIRGDEVLPGESLPAGQFERLRTTSDGTAYFIGSLPADYDKVLRTVPGMSGPIGVALTQGDTFGPLTLDHVLDFAVAPQGNLLAFTGVLDGNTHLLTDGQVVASVGIAISGFPDAVQSFGPLAVVSSGDTLFAAQTDVPRLFESNGATVTHSLLPQPTIAGVPMYGGFVASVSRSEKGQRLHLWHQNSESESALVLSCREIGNRSETLLLKTGQHLDFDGNGIADATVEEIDRFSGASDIGPLTDDVYVLTRLRHGSDFFEAVIRIDAPCPFFRSGFETGDQSDWSSTSP